MKRANLLTIFATSVLVLLFANSCVDPDPAGEFDHYSEFVGEAPAVAGMCATENRDISGLYFARLQHQIARENHILLSFDVTRSGDAYTLIVQPLKADVTPDGEPRSDARTPAGDAIVIENAPMDSSGIIQVQLDHVIVDGEANSLTWSEIDADFDLTIGGCTGEADFICGMADLKLYQPLDTDTEATFGAVRVDTIDMSSVAPVSCDGDEENDEENDE